MDGESGAGAAGFEGFRGGGAVQLRVSTDRIQSHEMKTDIVSKPTGTL